MLCSETSFQIDYVKLLMSRKACLRLIYRSSENDPGVISAWSSLYASIHLILADSQTWHGNEGLDAPFYHIPVNAKSWATMDASQHVSQILPAGRVHIPCKGRVL